MTVKPVAGSAGHKLHLIVNDVWVEGLPTDTTIIVRWTATDWARGHSRRLDTFLGVTPQLWLGLLPHVE